jgi:hypothetical protein
MITVELKNPVEIDGQMTTTVQIKEPRVKHMRETAHLTNAEERIYALVGTLAGITPGALGEMMLDDFDKLESAVTPFLPDSLKIGRLLPGDSLASVAAEFATSKNSQLAS